MLIVVRVRQRLEEIGIPVAAADIFRRAPAFRVLKGSHALYSIQRAWRSVPSDQALQDVMHALETVILCDTQAPEHACPSYDSLAPGQ